MKARNLLITTLLLVSMISLIVILPLTNAQQTTNLKIDPNTNQLTAAQIGTTINLNLTVSNVQNLLIWDLNLTWNPQVLNLTQIQEGSFLNNAGTTLFTWSPSSSPISRSQGYLQGVADILLATTGVNGNGVLATISFKVLATGTSLISLDGTTLSNSLANGGTNITATITNGIVNVGASNASPTPTAPPSTNPTTNPTIAPTTAPTTVPTVTTSTATPAPSSHTSVTPTQNPTPTVPEFQGIISIMLVLILSSVGIILLKKKIPISIKQ